MSQMNLLKQPNLKALYKAHSNAPMDIVDKLERVGRTLPKIDGHFWIERDGKIIDPIFKEYEIMKNEFKAVKFIYRPADELTQTLLTAVCLKQINKEYYTLGDYVADNITIYKKIPHLGRCLQNALIEQCENGGELVFGSFGVEKKDGRQFWEYGGADYVGVKDFIVKVDDYANMAIKSYNKVMEFYR